MKKIIRDNYRIELVPDTWGYGSRVTGDHEAMRRLLADIEKAVKRHVDGVEQVVPRWDTREECSHCGLRWEVLTAEEAADDSAVQDEHSVEGEPVCCEAGIDEFRAERGIPLLAEAGEDR
ncbi:hypothetical protein [Streptomyces acidiscabies]|uniref:hypothetical protein n=1 Tax=Streptomyces acidiscabies TaxID=42234 RepID=UPI00095107C0|nr:hypothetical protein [Streptomyces acidiscabies]